jgi:hypothetical protein
MKNNIFSAVRLRQIINDLKRRPIDAARDLNISCKVFNKILHGKKEIDEKFVKKAVKEWEVNLSDFLNPYFSKSFPYKIMKKTQSKRTSRVMQRGNCDYYEYQDTAMDRDAPFRPEWIKTLFHVEDNDPKNPLIKWNKGHLLHQLTYFVGPINFYYLNNYGQKKVAKMNTGDSMYIAPYVPHSFSTRIKKSNSYIVAITFSDEINNNIQNELTKLGKSKINHFFSDKKRNIKKVSIKRLGQIIKDKKLPANYFKIYQLAKSSIIPTANFIQVEVKKNNKKVNHCVTHQYIYIVSNKAEIILENKRYKFKYGDTLYIKPFTNFIFSKKDSKFVIAKVQSHFNTNSLNQISHLGKKNFSRVIEESDQWF